MTFVTVDRIGKKKRGKRTTYGQTRKLLRVRWVGPTCPRISTWLDRIPTSSLVSRRAVARKVLSDCRGDVFGFSQAAVFPRPDYYLGD
jgi:hypothetical protein